jgi:protein-disulfide isomerase
MSTLKSPVSEQDHVQGPATAKITLVEYGDYECPHCATAYPIAKRVEKHYGNDLRFVFRNFPLNQIHPYAESAAESAEFAAAHGKFWQMHDALFENQDRLGDDLYAELAQQLGLNPGDLAQALSDGTYTAHVRSDFSGGVRSGVNGTPTFFINGIRHDDSFDYETLVAAIEAALQSAPAKP